jgi:hypothetical protein
MAYARPAPLVILSAAKDLMPGAIGSFAALRMTALLFTDV